MRSYTVAAILMGLALVAGCENRTETSGGGVGVVNLERIALGTGQMQAIEGKKQAQITELQTQLVRRQTEMTREVEEQTKALGQTPTDEAKAKVDELKRKYNAEFQGLQGRAQQMMAGYEQELVMQFKQAIVPAAQKVARDRGITVLMQANPSLLAYEPSADLTDAIIEEIRTSKLSFGDGGLPAGPGGPTGPGAATQPGPAQGMGPAMPPMPPAGSAPAAPAPPTAPAAPAAPATPAQP